MINPIDVLSDPAHGVISEVRHPQRDLAKTILDAMETSTPLVAEAGTGVGKSYAYLLNAMWHLSQNPDAPPVAVCTAMKSLQQQLVFKDLPRLRDLLFPDLKFARVLGKGNYLCRRLVDAHEPKIPSNRKRLQVYQDFFDTVPNWVADDAPDSMRLPEDHWKHAVSYCNAERCAFYDDCTKHGYLAAKIAAKEADILVLNHAVLASDVRLFLQNKKAMLPDKLSYVIFDEAHRLPETLRNMLACDLNEKYFLRANSRYETLFEDASSDLVHYSKTACHDLLPEKLPGFGRLSQAYALMHREVRSSGYGQERTFGPAAKTYAQLCREVLREMGRDIGVGDSRFAMWAAGRLQEASVLSRFPRDNRAVMAVLSELHNYATTLEDHARSIDTIRGSDRASGRSSYVLAVSQDREDGGGGLEDDPKLQVLPLRLGRPMATYLHRKGAVPLYLSATLAVRSSFQGVVNELGIDMRVLQATTAQEPEQAVEEWLKSQQLEAVVPGSATYVKISPNNPVNSFISSSPFDYERQAVVYVPRDLPDPSTYGKRGSPTHPDYIRQLVAASRPLLDANEGHAFVLFTSNADLSAFDAELRRSGYPYPILSQAADNRLKSRGRDLFNATPHATLLGTRTFFEGIDIPGLGLSLVIIPKLPFASPTPVMEAKKREYEGFEGFMNVDIPIMLTDLRQMAGRLIRSTEDRGVLAILDPRVHTKRAYGKIALEELGMPNHRDREAPVVDYLRRVTLKRKGAPVR